MLIFLQPIGIDTVINENIKILSLNLSSIMIIKSLVIIAFILIIVSLGSALFHLVNPKTEEQSRKTVRALTIRISLSLILFIFIFIAVATGLYEPQGLGTKIHLQQPIQSESIK
jgi:hypothetical protein